MTSITFQSIIEINGINPYVLVSASHATQIKVDWRKPLPVRFRVNDSLVNRSHETFWRVNLMPVGDGSFYLYLDGDVRKASETEVGDRVSVEVQFDDEYTSGPTHPMPSWFAEPLNQNPRESRGQSTWSLLFQQS